MKSYKDLEIFQKGYELFFEGHSLSLKMPKFELYELASQLRRSADSTVTNIVEGYGRRTYKADFIKFLVYSQSSCLETQHHLGKINRLYLENNVVAEKLIMEYDRLGAQIYTFIKYVENHWNKPPTTHNR
jgi:four helix bundle protein